MNLFARRHKSKTDERQHVLRYLTQGVMELWTEDECDTLLRSREITVRYEGPDTAPETHRSWVVPVWRVFDEIWLAAIERHSQVVFPEEAAMLRSRWHEFLQKGHNHIREWLALMQACSSEVPPPGIRERLHRISILKNAEKKAEEKLSREARNLAKRHNIRAEELVEPFASRHAAPRPRGLHV
jgi:hypothetical protein